MFFAAYVRIVKFHEKANDILILILIFLSLFTNVSLITCISKIVNI